MINKIIAVLTVVMFSTSMIVAAAPSDEKMRVAVVEFDVKGEVEIKDAGSMVAEWMVSSLTKLGTYDLKERVLLKKLLEEQSLSESGVVSQETAAGIGSLYGVQGIIIGTIMKWGNTVSVSVRLVDTQTGSIIQGTDVMCNSINDIPRQIDYLAKDISGGEQPKVVLIQPNDQLLSDDQSLSNQIANQKSGHINGMLGEILSKEVQGNGAVRFCSICINLGKKNGVREGDRYALLHLKGATYEKIMTFKIEAVDDEASYASFPFEYISRISVGDRVKKVERKKEHQSTENVPSHN